MSGALFRFGEASRRHPAVADWFDVADPLRHLAGLWFDRMRACGPDVRELLHDHHPTACVEDAAFAYVDAFAEHVNVGFYHGAALPDPAGLLIGSGKRMRHVKLRMDQTIQESALSALIDAAYSEMRACLDSAE